MYIKDFTSSFTHTVKKFPIQIEILFSIFGNSKIKKDENDNYTINASYLIDAVLGDNIQVKKDEKTENIEDIEEKKEKMEEVPKENNNKIDIGKDPKDKDLALEEKKEDNLKEVKVKKKIIMEI